MDAVSYSRPDVIHILNERVVPVRVTLESRYLFRTYSVDATPTQLMIGDNGFIRQRSTGFLNGQELMAFLLLGIGKYYFDQSLIDDALKMVEKLIEEYRESRLIPEALFHRGFFLYKRTMDHRHLRETHKVMERRFPESAWTRSARMISLYHYAPSVWEWSRKKDNINHARFGVILTLHDDESRLCRKGPDGLNDPVR